MIINIKQALKAMYSLIHTQYLDSLLADIGNLASDMVLARSSDETADPASWYDWLDAIKKVKGSDVVPETLNIEEGYLAAIIFFNFEADLRSSEDLKTFIQTLTFEKWLEAVEAVDKGDSESLDS